MTMNLLIKSVICAAVALALVGCGDRHARTDAGATRGDSISIHGETHATAMDSSAVALCVAHGAPRNLCFICDASLREPGRLWCEEHAHYEDRCWECHPELRDKARLYCDEHGLYEDECFLCHPELRTSIEAPRDASTVLMCQEHGVEEQDCGICHPELASNLAPGQGLKIRFASAVAATKAGVGVERLGSVTNADVLTAVGELGYDMDHFARITSPVDGVVKAVHSDVGAKAATGTSLLSISSPRVSELRAQLIHALSEEEVAAQSLKREEDLFAKKAVSERELDDARARYRSAQGMTQAARQTLRDLGVTEKEVARLGRYEEEGSALALRAPFAGTVVERSATVGDVVKTGDVLFVVADLDVMWLTMAVTEGDAARLRVGAPVEVLVESLGQKVAGRVTWVSSRLDEATRMAQVRAEVPNQDHRLRAGMFVTARISVSDDRSALSVDRDAVHLLDGHQFVFVRLADDLFELRRVETRLAGDRVAVLAGLHAGDEVVTRQSYLVKSELQKSLLGAGCVD